MWRRSGHVAMDPSPDGCDTSQQRLPNFKRLATPSSVQPLSPSETWGCLMDASLFRLLSCTACRSAYFTDYADFMRRAREGVLLTAASLEGRELSVSVVGV